MTPAKPNRFHGRVNHQDGRLCNHPTCHLPGEFKAPRSTAPEVDGYHWFCLEHVREYNANWNFFDKATPGQAEQLSHGYGGWDRPTWPFGHAPNGASPTLHDIHSILKEQPGFHNYDDAVHPVTGKTLSSNDRKALTTLGLDAHAGLEEIRKRYRSLLKRYHPDQIGGDRTKEAKLRNVINAYKHLTKDGKTNRSQNAAQNSRN